MKPKRFLNRKMKSGLQKSFIIFMSMLVILSGALPYTTPLVLAEGSGSQLPVVSKDIDGEESKEVIKGEAYPYHINVLFPADVTDYESVTISDELDTRLEVQGTSVLIDREVNEEYQAVVDGQHVSLSMSAEQLNDLAGKEVKLQITTTISEDAVTGEEIQNIANVSVNDNLTLETNPVTISLIELASEEESTEGAPEVADEKAQEDEGATVVSEEGQPVEEESKVNKLSQANSLADGGDVLSSQVPVYPFNGARELTVFNKIGFYHLQAIGGSNVYGYDVSNDPKIKGRYIDVDNDSSTYSSTSMEYVPNGEVEAAFLYIPTENISATGDGTGTYIQGPSGGRLYFDSSTEGVYDITAFVKKEGAGHYWGKNLEIRNPLAIPWGWDALSNWGIVFVEENEDLPPMMTKLNFYYGVSTNSHPNFTATLSDQPFLTKQEGSLKGSMVASVFGGNQNIDNAQYKMISYKDGQIVNESYMSDDAREENNFWNGSITRNGENISARNPDRTPANTDIFNYDFTDSPYFPAGIDRIDSIFTALPVNENGSIDQYYPKFWGVALEVIPSELEITKNVKNKLESKTYYEVGDTVVYSIVAKNKVEDTIAKNFSIQDELPAGLELIEGTLQASHNVVPAYDNGKITADFGNVSDVEERTVTFEAKILDDQAGNVINNVASVTSDGLEPEEAEAKVIVNPTEIVDACAVPVALINGSFEDPVYSPEFSTGPGYFTIGQSLVPGWQTTDSTGTLEIFNQSLMDQISPGSPQDQQGLKNEVAQGQQFAELNSKEPAQLYQDVETTPGQIIYWRLAHKGRLGDDTMAVKVGSAEVAPKDLPIIEEITTSKDKWQYYSGIYTVPAGQTVTRFGFESISAAGGNPAAGNFLDDIFLGTEPCVVAEKTVSPEGEVFAGQELTYEVTVKNNGGDIAADVVFEDVIPEGTEYVPGSLKIIDGPGAGDLTDEEGDDAGHFDGEKVIIELGDLPNTNNLPDGITVQFKVKALDTDTEREVTNKALIHYDNLLTNESETTETTETTSTILPREEIDACAAPVALINGSFEEPTARMPGDTGSPGAEQYWMYFYEDEVPGWQTSATDKFIQIMKNEYIYQYEINPPHGNQYAELNAHQVSALYQDVETIPGQTIYWRLAHRGLLGVDTMAVQIGSADIPADDLPVIDEISTDKTEWVYYSGTYIVPAGQATTRFAFNSVDAAGGSQAFGNLLDDIFLGTEPCVVAEKTVSPEGEVLAGQELTYEVTVKNNGGDIAANAVFEDAIPTGTEYVPGSLKIIDGPGTGDLTDQKGDDAGWYDEENNKVIIELGDLPNINDLANGVTVQFKVKALVDDTVSEIINKAKINYDNLLTNESKTTESNETTTELAYQDPVLESQKTAEVLEKADGNTDLEHPEVGDKLLYTIQTRNTVENSLVKNLVISDLIPEGLEYVTGTLTVDGEDVTDEEDDDAGHNINGEIFGSFGDITDTEWHSVTFQVVVGEGQAGKDIKNIATVDGDNLEEPDEPSEEVLVYPREPKLDSDKFSSIEEKGEGNIDTEKYQVGDRIKYTIQARNTVRESAVENFVISDVLPEGLTYVEGSLEVSHDGTGTMEDGILMANFGDVTDVEWRIVTFLVTIDSGQSGQTIQNTATVDGDNVDEPDEPSEEIQVDPREPKLESEKTYDIAEKLEGNTDTEHPEVGDILTYTIQTRNTIEDSLIEKLTIRDVLPEGLEYVEGTLTVDDVSVTDEEDDDAGHSVDGEIFGAFGDITDTEWHKVTFQVVVGEGQAGQDIKNIATVDGDNIDEPDEPSEEVLVYPREPKLDSDKFSSIEAKGEGNTDTEKYQVGDTIKYTIQARNTVRESVVENFIISDVLPEGLTYVEGSLEVSHDGTGTMEGGTLTASFGDVTDVEWRIVTFLVTINSGQSGQIIKNTATVDGDNNDEPDKPENEFTVDPKEPKLESEKTATIAEKLEGNTDADNPEVGDILTYTIQTRNTVEDSLIENLTIRDVLPEGLEYVEGTLTIDGEAVTDEEDDDAGHSVDGEIFGAFGDVTDTEWHTLTFQVVVGTGQAGQDIKNIATVDGDNIDEPDEPSEEVLVYPREPKLDSDKFSSIEAKGDGNTDTEKYQVGDMIKYTIQARNTVKDSVVENFEISDVLPEGLTYVEGSLEVSHDGTGTMEDGILTANFGDVTDVEWRIVTFLATIDSGQSGQTIQNTATVDGDNVEDPDEPSEEVRVEPREPKLESEKTYDIAEKLEGNTDADNPEVGDILTYTIQTRNTIEDSLIENLTIRDVLPEGLEYVEGTLTVDGVAVTDEEDDDAGHSVDGEIFGAFGDITDTEWHKVTFQVVVGEGQAGQDIKNVATVNGDNIDEPDEPSEEVLVYPREPKLESEKASSIVEKGEGNTDKEKYQVGDMIEYTIQSRNTVKESLIENLVISDVLPEGLTYVEGSLEVSHEGIGNYKDGTIAASFGDVTDTEWRTVTFQATIDAGQSGQTIKNIATVDGDNLEEPENPEREITVDPKEPKLESEKTSSIAEKLEGNTDTEHPEVGDTLTYTIQTRNTIEDSLVKNLSIRDELPEGLEYVAGSLTVDGVSVTDEEDDDAGHSVDGEIFGAFGDVTDTEWHSVTFQVIVGEGQAGKDIENIATVDGDNVNKPDQPSEEVLVYPREQKVESEKTSSIVEKGEGNTDTEKYQVGDTIEYTIQARNMVKESLIENLVISDVLPEGLSYVEGSLEVSHEGIGNYKDGTITASFGDVTDTEWRTVTFQAIIDAGQSNQTIKNTATVDGDNIEEPDKPSEEILVYPREPKVESEKTAKNVEEGKEVYEVGDTVVYTIRARNTEKDSLIEKLVISDVLPEGLTYVEGTLEVSHKGTAVMEAGTLTASFGDVSDTEWRTVTFHVTIDANQFGNTIKNVATVEADNMEDPEKPTEEIVIEKKKPSPPVKVEDNQPKQPETPKPNTPVNEGKELPKTATNHYNLMLVGFILLLVGTIIWYWKRRRENA